MKIKEFQHFYQTGENDCGNACIRMIAAYYKIENVNFSDIPLTQLSIYDIISCLKKINVEATGLQIKSKAGLGKIEFPYIVLLNNEHYIIIYNKYKEYYYVADPKKGNIRIHQNKLDSTIFNAHNSIGKIIKLQFMKEEVCKNVLHSIKYTSLLLNFLKQEQKQFARLILLIFLITILQGLTPFFFRAIIDLGINKDNFSLINVLVLANFVLIVGIGLGNLIKERLSIIISEDYKHNLIDDYLKKTLNNLNILNQLKVGNMLRKVKDIQVVSNFVTNNFVYFLTSSLIACIYLVILFVFNNFIFIIFLSGTITYIIWQLCFTKFLKLLENDTRLLQIKDGNFWADTINSIYDIKSYNAENIQISSWKDTHKDLKDNTLKDLKVRNIQQFGNHLINGTQRLLILYFSVTNVFDGDMTFGTMISIQFIVGFMSTPITSIVVFIGYYFNFKILVTHLDKDHKTFNEYLPAESAIKINNIEKIQCFNTNLLYPSSSSHFLQNIDLKIYKGKKYAFVGKSGSGKSSLIKLILGLHFPASGRMEVNNISISEIDSGSYRHNFSVVLQESRLIEGTIIDNITYKSNSVDFERLNEVVKLANLQDILSQYQNGLFSEINNSSRGISDGQKQRILIARSLYRYREYLVLDEATSALDSYNKYTIFKNILNQYESKTLLVATHDLNLIKDFDVIVVLNKGKIVEMGSHESLLMKRGFYSVLFNVQNKTT